MIMHAAGQNPKQGRGVDILAARAITSEFTKERTEGTARRAVQELEKKNRRFKTDKLSSGTA